MVIIMADTIAKGNGMCSECEGRHAADHHKFTLGKIDDTCRIVNYIEAYRHDGIDGTVGNTGYNILK
jgi:hypothetical protein